MPARSPPRLLRRRSGATVACRAPAAALALAHADVGTEVVAWDAMAHAVRRIADVVDWPALDGAPDRAPEPQPRPAPADWRARLRELRALYPDPASLPGDVAQALRAASLGVAGADLTTLIRGLADGEAG